MIRRRRRRKKKVRDDAGFANGGAGGSVVGRACAGAKVWWMKMAALPQEWISELFGKHYRTCAVKPSIPDIARREFGFGGWEKKIEFRHLAFGSQDEFLSRLVQDRPLYVSCSAAYYSLPAARPMPKKEWLGADLIFDLDAAAHSCAPFTCEKCFAKVKTQAQRLIEEFLVPDFGISKDDMQLNFSGSRGYHVRVYTRELRALGREERREIVDYIQGTGMSFSSFFSEETRTEDLGKSRMAVIRTLRGPKPGQGGYYGKFANAVVKIAQDAAQAGVLLSPKLKKKEQADRFVEGVREGNWSRVPIAKQDEKYRAIFESLAVKLSDQVDANVTCDTAKILRVPDSLHGASGLVAKTVKMNGLEKFEPTRDAIAFSNNRMVRIRVQNTASIAPLSWNGQATEQMAAGTEIEVPESLAVYLVCKRAAVPI